MTARYPRLLAPGALGPLEVRNRILMCPMGDSLGNSDGTVSERQAAYFEARARGGTGLLLVGSVAVSYPAGSYDTHQLGISSDRFLPGLTTLTAACHRHGAAVATQLVHDGLNALFDIAEGRPLLVPSPPPAYAPDRLSRMVTPDEELAMTAPFRHPGAALSFKIADEDDLAAVIASFAGAARRARAAGFDGVEIHAGHGYLIDAFLSPASNTRTDRWGGTVGNRARLLCDVIRAIRASEGAGFAVWCRINAVEHFQPGGETPEDAVQVAKLAVDAGADAIHVSAYAARSAALGVTTAHTPHDPAALVDYAAMIKTAVFVPVIAFGRLEPLVAEDVLASGKADFIAMGRKLLADPDLPNKLAAGNEDEIRPCIYQYRCIGNIFLGSSVSCVVNATTGHEDRGPLPRTITPRRVLVAGGGPAGLETARLLAGAGHDVALWEAADRLGGRLALGAATDESLHNLLMWLVRQVAAAGVACTLGRAVTVDDIDGIDEVIVATGALWGPPTIAGGERAWTVDDARGWLDGTSEREPGERVVILGGGKVGLSLASFAAARGRTVTVVERGTIFGVELGLPGRFRLVHDVEAQGVTLVGNVTPSRIDDDGVHHSADQVINADTVVSAVAENREPPLLRDLRTAGVSAHSVGDGAGYRGIEGAMADADALARTLR